MRMRALYAVAILALLTGQAYAQAKNPGPPAPGAKTQQEIAAERRAEQAYKNSLKNIPDQPAADPWGIARGAETPKAAAKAAPAKP
jgi:hypothetical protein